MSEITEVLGALPMFSSLEPDELEAVSALVVEREYAEGDIVFQRGDEGPELLVVVSGVLEVFVLIAEEVERTVITARTGAAIGMLTFVDGGVQAGTARAVEKTKTLVMDRSAVPGLVEDHPGVAAKLMSYIASNLAGGMRVVESQYLASLEWSHSVAGITALNLQHLITERVRVHLDLVTGGEVCGRVLKVERSEAGHEVFLETEKGEVLVVPYHAIVVFRFDEAAVESAQTKNSEL